MEIFGKIFLKLREFNKTIACKISEQIVLKIIFKSLV